MPLYWYLQFQSNTEFIPVFLFITSIIASTVRKFPQIIYNILIYLLNIKYIEVISEMSIHSAMKNKYTN
jgi:hypothetical protein